MATTATIAVPRIAGPRPQFSVVIFREDSPMSAQTAAEREMAELLISALNLEGVSAPDIQPTQPLFGAQGEGLGLDSIDALEIALAVSVRYGVQLRADDA